MHMQTTTLSYDYLAFGLRIRSELPFPELKTTENAALPDLSISRSKIPDILENPTESNDRFSAKRGEILVKFSPNKRIFVKNGAQIFLDYSSDQDLQSIRPHILGNIIACVLYMRGLAPLHAGSFVARDHAVAICGESGQGKSTLIAAIQSLGHPALSDDITTIDANSTDDTICFAGPRRAKLNRESLNLLKRKISPTYEFEPIDRKYLLDDHIWAEKNKYPLKAIFELKSSNTINKDQIQPATGIEKIGIIEKHLFKPSLMQAVGNRGKQASSIINIASKVRVYKITRSQRTPLHPIELAQKVLNLL